MDFKLEDKMHSVRGDYSNTREAMEDLVVLINTNTKALIHLAKGLTKLSERINDIDRELTKQDNGIDSRLNSFKGDINAIKRDIGIIQGRIKNIGNVD